MFLAIEPRVTSICTPPTSAYAPLRPLTSSKDPALALERLESQDKKAPLPIKRASNSSRFWGSSRSNCMVPKLVAPEDQLKRAGHTRVNKHVHIYVRRS